MAQLFTSNRLSEWLSYIESLHPEEIELGLERIKQVYKKLPQLPESLPVITVAGTNGKGSTVKSLEALGIVNGKKVGAYTSPHLLKYNERVQFNQEPVTDAQLVEAFTEIEQARANIELTYFEYGTLAALVIFAEADLDFVVLEVGLGGRLDAVNIIDPTVAVITSVALDHESWLGNTREAIGEEKAGIVRSDAVFVCGDPAPPQSVKQKGETAAKAYWRGNQFCIAPDEGRNNSQLSVTVDGDKQAQLVIPAGFPLMPDNVVVAIQVLAILGTEVSQGCLNQALGLMNLSGRQQLIRKAPYILLDVGHNPQAATGLSHKIRQLKHQYSVKRTICLLGMLADKNHQSTLAELLPEIDTWWVTNLDAGPRSLSAECLADLLLQAGAVVESRSPRPLIGYRSIKQQLQADDLLVVFGSFYTVADILPEA